MGRAKTRKCSRCEKNRALRFFTPKGRICADCRKKTRSKASHEARVQDVYGLGPNEYDELIEAQGGVCAICKQSRKYRLNLDHSHKTGILRGGCCRLCNGRLLTAARDNPEILRAAADYLENPPAVQILGVRLHKDFRKEEGWKSGDEYQDRMRSMKRPAKAVSDPGSGKAPQKGGEPNLRVCRSGKPHRRRDTR